MCGINSVGRQFPTHSHILRVVNRDPTADVVPGLGGAALGFHNAVGDAQVEGVGASTAAIADYQHIFARLGDVQNGSRDIDAWLGEERKNEMGGEWREGEGKQVVQSLLEELCAAGCAPLPPPAAPPATALS